MTNKQFFCKLCNKFHNSNSKLGKEHFEWHDLEIFTHNKLKG
jgi:hypothetical protein